MPRPKADHEEADLLPRPVPKRLPDRPTIWHKLQIAFPWGAPLRLRKKPERKPREEQAA